MTNNNSSWLRIALAVVGILAAISLTAFGFMASKTIANTERIVALEIEYSHIKAQLDRIEGKLDDIEVTTAKTNTRLMLVAPKLATEPG